MENRLATGAPQGGEHAVATLSTSRATAEVGFTARLASLGKDRDRWCLVIPRTTAQMLPKNAIYQVTLRPIGSLR